MPKIVTPYGEQEVDPIDADKALTEETFRQLTINAVVGCKKHPMIATPCYTCAHVVRPDDESIEKIYKIPPKWFVCKSCYNRIERKKFWYSRELQVWCLFCVEGRIFVIKNKNPDLFQDCTLKG